MKLKLLVLSFFCLPFTYAQSFYTGHTTLTFTDSTRSNRPVLTEVYYPATSAGTNTPIASASYKFPVVAFGHGLGISTSLYEFLFDSLVAHGFIVVLPNTETSASPSFSDFSLDLRFVIKSMRKESINNSSAFYNKVSTLAAIGGHSMGGGCSIQATSNDSTANCLFNFATAAIVSGSLANQIHMPTLMFGGDKDCVCPPTTNQAPYYNSIPASNCKAIVVLTGADHCQFAAPSASCQSFETSCGVFATIPDSAQQNRTLQYLLPFLRWQLMADAAQETIYKNLLKTSPNASTLTNCYPVSVPQLQEDAITLTPNPASDFLNIQLNKGYEYTITIYNMLGEVMYTSLSKGNAGITISNWPQGNYICHVTAAGIQFNKRVSIIH